MTELKTPSIMLTVEQWERLRDEAHETRRSQSEIVREGSPRNALGAKRKGGKEHEKVYCECLQYPNVTKRGVGQVRRN